VAAWVVSIASLRQMQIAGNHQKVGSDSQERRMAHTPVGQVLEVCKAFLSQRAGLVAAARGGMFEQQVKHGWLDLHRRVGR
jgi:hypothetical protein